MALENARRKARAALLPGAAEAVLGCDTIVVLDGTIYGKPADEAAARATIAALGGRTHEVISGVALLLGGEEEAEERTALARSRVSFRALDEQLHRLVRGHGGVARTLGRLCDPGRDRRPPRA